ncbi:hypothetical protein LP420_24205 [Massilia sp. B-10]|nr:hypothetical protein LP420_24205 [Massilia sp. B-10]
MKIANLRIGARLGLGFAIVLVLLAASIGLGLRNMGLMHDSVDRITDEFNVDMDAANDMSKAQMRVSIASSTMVMLTDA